MLIRNVLVQLSFWHIMGSHQITVWAVSIPRCLWASFLFEINVCVPSYVFTQTQLCAMWGYYRSALMWCSAVIGTVLCPIRHRDCQWKCSTDDFHLMIKPIMTWKAERNSETIREMSYKGKKTRTHLSPIFKIFFFSIFGPCDWM